MKHLLLAVAATALLTATSCQVNYDKTKSGLLYKIASTKNGEQVKAGQFVKFNVEFKVYPKDSLLNTTYGKFPGYSKLDTGKNVEYSFFEIMPNCKVGDSVEFTMSIDTMKNRNMIKDYEGFLVRNGQIKGKFTILKTFATEDLVKADYEKENELVKTREVAAVQAYVTKKGIKAEKTQNGVFVEITKQGDPAFKVDSSKQAMVMYRGYLMDDEKKVFDTNMDTTKGHTEAYPVVVGRHGVIPGWEEALPYFTKGAEGKIYVPSLLAYGARGGGSDIPAYANLIFDIKVVDVTPAPAVEAPKGNPFGNLTPEQMQQLQQQMQQRQQQGGQQAPPPQK